ncbi:MAG: SpoIIE family protein phosphatase [Planctomycetota bacterium]
MRILPRHWPIAWRITGGLLIAAIVPLVIVVMISSGRAWHALEENALKQLNLIAEATGDRIDQMLEDYGHTVASMQRNERILSMLRGDSSLQAGLMRDARLNAQTDPVLLGLYITDLEGNILVASRDESLNKNVAFRHYWKAARNGHRFNSSILVGKNTGEAGIYLSGPVTGDDGTVEGVIFVKLDARAVRRIVQTLEIDEQGGGMLIDDNMVIIASPLEHLLYHSIRPLPEEAIARIDPLRRWGRETIPLAPVAAADELPHQTGGGTWTAKVDGERYVAGSARLEQVPWRLMVWQTETSLEEPLKGLMAQQLSTVAFVTLFALLFVVSHSRSILEPVRELSGTAERLAGGDLDARVPIHGTDELGRLAAVFNRMIPELRQGLDMRNALALAHEVQQNLLPSSSPAFPGLDIVGGSVPADETGGDYFDFFDLRRAGDDRLAIAIGDVVGHGVAAALLMATARANLRACARPLGELGPLFSVLNNLLAEDVRNGQFMSLLLLVYDPAKREVCWINAGHQPPFHYQASDGAVSERRTENIPLGVMPNANFEPADPVRVEVGDVILLGTDGIWEAQNAAGEEFGRARVVSVLQQHHELDARGITVKMQDALTRFRDGVPFKDDVTGIVIKVTDA